MQKRYHVSFKRVIKRLDADIKAKRESEDDDEERPVNVQSKPHDPENENEVRQLFGSLLA